MPKMCGIELPHWNFLTATSQSLTVISVVGAFPELHLKEPENLTHLKKSVTVGTHLPAI